MEFKDIGLLLVLFGVIMVIVGGAIYFSGGLFSWLGRLPGDIRIEKENFSFYFPITTMIIISVFLNLIIRIFLHFFR